MINYIVYEKDTGKPLRWGNCQDDMLEATREHFRDYEVIEGTIDVETSWVDIDTKKVISKPKAIVDKEKADKDAFALLQAEELMIRVKADEILRALAVDALKKEGKLPK
jgi:hypothetical protein